MRLDLVARARSELETLSPNFPLLANRKRHAARQSFSDVLAQRHGAKGFYAGIV